MSDTLKLSYTAALVLQTISSGYTYGFDIMEVTGLPSGTVYPTLRRLEQQELIKSSWETQHAAFADQRPVRKYYRLTRDGKEALGNAVHRYALLERLVSAEKSKRR
jgi:DNA-binding PadR family transcriptional regulator